MLKELDYMVPDEVKENVAENFDPNDDKYGLPWPFTGRVSRRHGFIVAGIEAGFLCLCLLLNIIHYAANMSKLDGDKGSVPLMLFLTLSQIFLAAVIETLFILGLIFHDTRPYLAKKHPVCQMAATIFLIIDGILSLAIDYGGRADPEYYAIWNPLLIRTLACLCLIMAVVEIYLSFITRAVVNWLNDRRKFRLAVYKVMYKLRKQAFYSHVHTMCQIFHPEMATKLSMAHEMDSANCSAASEIDNGSPVRKKKSSTGKRQRHPSIAAHMAEMEESELEKYLHGESPTRSKKSSAVPLEQKYVPTPDLESSGQSSSEKPERDSEEGEEEEEEESSTMADSAVSSDVRNEAPTSEPKMSLAETIAVRQIARENAQVIIEEESSQSTAIEIEDDPVFKLPTASEIEQIAWAAEEQLPPNPAEQEYETESDFVESSRATSEIPEKPSEVAVEIEIPPPEEIEQEISIEKSDQTKSSQVSAQIHLPTADQIEQEAWAAEDELPPNPEWEGKDTPSESDFAHSSKVASEQQNTTPNGIISNSTKSSQVSVQIQLPTAEQIEQEAWAAEDELPPNPEWKGKDTPSESDLSSKQEIRMSNGILSNSTKSSEPTVEINTPTVEENIVQSSKPQTISIGNVPASSSRKSSGSSVEIALPTAEQIEQEAWAMEEPLPTNDAINYSLIMSRR